MDEYARGNIELWNELTPIHANSEFYKLKEFKSGEIKLKVHRDGRNRGRVREITATTCNATSGWTRSPVQDEVPG